MKLNSFKKLTEKSIELVRGVKVSSKTNGLWDELWEVQINNEKQLGNSAYKQTLSTPTPTRWYSYIIMFDKLIKSKDAVRQFVTNPKSLIRRDQFDIAWDDEYWEKCIKMKYFLEPIIEDMRKSLLTSLM